MTNNINYFSIPPKKNFLTTHHHSPRPPYETIKMEEKLLHHAIALVFSSFRAYLGRSPSNFLRQQFSFDKVYFCSFLVIFVKITHESFSQYWLSREDKAVQRGFLRVSSSLKQCAMGEQNTPKFVPEHGWKETWNKVLPLKISKKSE